MDDLLVGKGEEAVRLDTATYLEIMWSRSHALCKLPVSVNMFQLNVLVHDLPMDCGIGCPIPVSLQVEFSKQ